jgi:hypothetical protein
MRELCGMLETIKMLRVIDNYGRPVGTRTADLYRVNPQFIDLSTIYWRSQGLLTPLGACKFVQHRAGHRVGVEQISCSFQ